MISRNHSEKNQLNNIFPFFINAPGLSSYSTKPPRLTQHGHPSVGKCSEYQQELLYRHTAQCTSPVSVVSQCKPVSGCGLRKWSLSSPYGPYGLGRSFRFYLLMFDVHLCCPLSHLCMCDCTGVST